MRTVAALLLLAGALAVAQEGELAPVECQAPLACPAPGAVVLSADGKARFTVLGDQLLRMEWAANGTFDDRQTLAFVNRKLPVPSALRVHHMAGTNGTTTVTTASLKLTYMEHTSPAPAPPPTPAQFCTGTADHDAVCDGACEQFRSPHYKDGVSNKTQAQCCALCQKDPSCNVWISAAGIDSGPQPLGTCYLLTRAVGTKPAKGRMTGGNVEEGGNSGFTAQNLRVSTLPGIVPAFDWKFGDMDAGNLLGTSRSLDGVTGSVDLNCSSPNATSGCDLGPISRDGWAIVDDSSNNRIDPTSDWIVADEASRAYSDLYFFGFGTNYTAALRAFSSIAGSAPMPPRFTLGVWWSRYWPCARTIRISSLRLRGSFALMPLAHICRGFVLQTRLRISKSSPKITGSTQFRSTYWFLTWPGTTMAVSKIPAGSAS